MYVRVDSELVRAWDAGCAVCLGLHHLYGLLAGSWYRGHLVAFCSRKPRLEERDNSHSCGFLGSANSSVCLEFRSEEMGDTPDPMRRWFEESRARVSSKTVDSSAFVAR